jgi:sec-independent protein translocase protein TatB
MFEVGFTELLVIFVLALVVLGPEKLPRLAAQVGRWVGRARAMAKQFREQLEDEVNLADTKKWESAQTQSSQSQPPPAQPAGTPESSTAEPPSPAPNSETNSSSAQTSSWTSTETPAPAAADNTNAANGHYSGPPPEPEAPVYQPPAYANPGAASPDPSTPTPQDHTTSAPDERPLRPGDVITTTHERGP